MNFFTDDLTDSVFSLISYQSEKRQNIRFFQSNKRSLCDDSKCLSSSTKKRLFKNGYKLPTWQMLNLVPILMMTSVLK